MTLPLAALVLIAIGAPPMLRLERTSPALGAFIWLAALALRALTAVFCAVLVVLYLPSTQLFAFISHWCWDAFLPLIASHAPLDGHLLGDLALVTPAFVLAASALSAGFGLWRGARRVRLLVRRAVVGRGPRGSLVLADGDVLVGAAGLRRPQVVISAGALVTFDDAELTASLEHEHGHIARGHRYLLVFAELCRALARFVPGTRAAAEELVFQLERDADRYAVARTNDPAALASAICKASQSAALGAPGLALSGGTGARRVRLLLDGDPVARARHDMPFRALATVMVVLFAVTVATLPAAAHDGYHKAGNSQALHHCTS